MPSSEESRISLGPSVAQQNRAHERLMRRLEKQKERDMPEKIEDGGPAFPSEQSETIEGAWNQTLERGMTLRDWFAGQALAAIIRAGEDSVWTPAGPHDACAQQAYMYADAMLRARTTDGDAS